MRDAEYRLGLILVAASALAWSTAGLFTRIIAVDTGTMLVWRGVFGALGILAIVCAMQGRDALRDFAKMGVPGWTFAVISAVGMLCFISSLRLTTVAHVSFIYATVPLVAAVLAWLVIGERPSRSALVASAASLIGVGVIVGLGVEGNLIGDLLAFGMTMSLAAMMVISRKFKGIPIMPAAWRGNFDRGRHRPVGRLSPYSTSKPQVKDCAAWVAIVDFHPKFKREKQKRRTK
jgi:drug/metabolite transporter (DMT)-like permease